jgi:hypothetical protein
LEDGTMSSGSVARGLLGDLGEFVTGHRPHGALHAEAGHPTPNGYMLTVACSCGVTFYRWVASVDAAVDLAFLARLN